METQLDEAGLSRLFDQFASSDALVTWDRRCALFGEGGQTRLFYHGLSETPGLEVVWRGDFGPWWMRPLTLIAAAHGGLIRVRDQSVLPGALEGLTHLAMVGVYSFRRDHWLLVEDHVRSARWRSCIRALLEKHDPTYFFLGIDGNPVDASPYVVWSSCGPKCPASLLRLVGELQPREHRDSEDEEER